MNLVRKLFADRVVIACVAIGTILMTLTVLTRVNPAEGSVVRPEFLQTPLGRPVAMLLLITSLPGWAGVILSASLSSFFQHKTAVWIELFLFQILGYWLLGKVLSIGWRKSRLHGQRS